MTTAADLLEPRSRRLARWIGAATLIAAIHVAGGSYAMLHWEEEPEDDSGGAIAIEIAPVATALPMEPLDVAPGPRMEESMPTQQSSEQKVEKVEEDTPVEDLPAPVPDPEVVLQKHTPVEEKIEEPQKEEPRPELQAPEQTIAAPQTTAPPRIEAEVSKKAAAPQVGSSAADARSVLTWHKAVALHLNRHKRYPSAAKARGIQGNVHVRFAMDRSGNLTAVEVTRSSGSTLLDAETINILKRAAPLPRPPPAVVGERLELSVPIRFRITP